MTITSLGFVAFLMLAVAVFHLAPGRWRAGMIFPLTTLIFIVLIMPSVRAVCAVLGFAALVWGAAEVTFRWPRRRAQVLVLAGVLAVFGWMKAYEFLSFLPFASLAPATIGLSYILIRALQLLIDLAETPSLRPRPVTLFSFLLSWPCLISGPIQRYQEFTEQLGRMAAFRLTDEVVLASVGRMIKGCFWVLVAADMTKHLWLGLKGIAFEGAYPLAFGSSQMVFLAHLFFDFAGYTEIVIGAGMLFGLRLPENFNRPFDARSFLDFWSRWHMSMSGWFKVYVFNPLLSALTKRWPDQGAANVLAAMAFFATFFLVGLWHGTTSAFVACGVLLGVGACVNQWYRAALRGKLGKKRFDALGKNRVYGAVAAGVTFTYLCLSIAPLWLTPGEMGRIIQTYRFRGLAYTELFVLGFTFLAIPWRLPAIPGLSRFQWWPHLKLGAQCAVIELYVFLFPSFGGAFFYEQF